MPKKNPITGRFIQAGKTKKIYPIRVNLEEMDLLGLYRDLTIPNISVINYIETNREELTLDETNKMLEERKNKRKGKK